MLQKNKIIIFTFSLFLSGTGASAALSPQETKELHQSLTQLVGKENMTKYISPEETELIQWYSNLSKSEYEEAMTDERAPVAGAFAAGFVGGAVGGFAKTIIGDRTPNTVIASPVVIDLEATQRIVTFVGQFPHTEFQEENFDLYKTDTLQKLSDFQPLIEAYERGSVQEELLEDLPTAAPLALAAVRAVGAVGGYRAAEFAVEKAKEYFGDYQPQNMPLSSTYFDLN